MLIKMKYVYINKIKHRNLKINKGRGSKTTTPVLVARGGLEKLNPATTTHSGMGVKETHNFMLWEKRRNKQETN